MPHPVASSLSTQPPRKIGPRITCLRRLRNGLLPFTLLLFAITPPARCQNVSSPPAPPAPIAQPAPLVFDLASIRPNNSDQHARSHIYNSPDNAQFKAVNVPLLALLSYAFALPETQILNAPAWLRTEKFDLEAKADPSLDSYMRQLPPASARLEKQKMLQALFADRFQLAARPETRELPLFVLIAAKTGATLLPSKASGTTIDTHRGQFIATGVPLSSLAEALARETGRVVLDQTGITGRFDITLTWVPTDDTSPPADSSGPSLFTAIQEQLGLKLEGRKGQVPVLVIDRVDHPSAN